MNRKLFLKNIFFSIITIFVIFWYDKSLKDNVNEVLIGRDVFLTSAYYIKNDSFFGNNNGVVIVTILTANIKLFSFLCFTRNENDTILSRGKFFFNYDYTNKTCQYTTLFLVCPVLKKSKVVGIIDESKNDSLLFNYFLNKPSKQFDITICYGSLFMFNDIEKFVLTSEMFFYNNIDRIQVYFKSGSLKEWNLLKKYRDFKNGKIHIKRMASFFKKDINYKNYKNTVPDHLWFSNKEAISMDCFLKYRNSKFVIFSNYDEMLMDNNYFKNFLIKSIYINSDIKTLSLNVINDKNKNLIIKRKIIINKNINNKVGTSKYVSLKYKLISLKYPSTNFYKKIPHNVINNFQNFFQTNKSIISILKQKEKENFYLNEYMNKCSFYFDISTKCQEISSWCIKESKKIKNFKCIYMWNNYQIHTPNIRTTFRETTCCKYFNFNTSCPIILDPKIMKGKEKFCKNEL